MLTPGETVMRLKIKPDSTAQHHIFIHKHTPSNEDNDWPRNRTIQIFNVPPFVDEVAVKRIFSSYGTIELCYSKKQPGRTPAYRDVVSDIEKPSTSRCFLPDPPPCKFYSVLLVFEEHRTVDTILSTDHSQAILVYPDKSTMPPLGFKKYALEYKQSIVPENIITQEIESFMEDYDARKAEEKRQAKLIKSRAGTLTEPDEDGWITVTRSGKRPGIPRKQSVTEKIRHRHEKKQKAQEDTKFYTFQIKESKMKRLEDLQQKFEEDKKRIALLRTARRFKPY